MKVAAVLQLIGVAGIVFAVIGIGVAVMEKLEARERVREIEAKCVEIDTRPIVVSAREGRYLCVTHDGRVIEP